MIWRLIGRLGDRKMLGKKISLRYKDARAKTANVYIAELRLSYWG